MGESHGLDHLLAARDILKSSIEISRNIGVAVDETGSRLNEARHNLASLQLNIRDMACKCAVYEIRDHLDRAIGPAAAVLRVLDLVFELQDSLKTDPRASGLFTYLTSIKRLQEALKLLDDSCRLVILWLEDVVRILKNNAADYDDDRHLVRVAKVVKILVGLQLFCQDEGKVVLSSAFNKLEGEYSRLLTEDLSPYCEEETSIKGPLFPAPMIQELRVINEVMAANHRLEKCVSVHAQDRIANARATIKALNVDYLDFQLSETDSVQSAELHIHQWDKNMEFVVRDLLWKEYRLCNEVYQKFGSDVWMNCFAKIATQCGFLDIFDFSSSICRCKKEAIKLLSLLRVFSTLDRLRLEFNEMFDGRFCVKIQNQTRTLVKKVVNGACEIFWELLAQVELQRGSNPPSDGNVPRLVCFVSEYCNQLLEDENRSFLTRVLFMMNSHWYLFNSTRGTKLGDLMGDSWLCAYEESTKYYTALYMRESWEKLLVFLHEEGLILFPGGRAIDRNLVKKRIGGFCDAFDEMYKKQSKWIVYDKALRLKMHQLIVEAIVPPYKSYLHRFMPGLEHESDMGSHVRYTGESLESIIGSLFQQKIGKYGSSKCTDMIGIKNAAAMNHFSSSTPAAA